MAEISLSLGELFERTFGYKTRAFDPEFSHVNGIKKPFRKEEGVQGASFYAKDQTGTEYYMPVTLLYPDTSPGAGSSERSATNGGIARTAIKQWNLPYPIISATSRKTIVETVLTERRGTVKELINIQDYEIVIKGFLIGVNNEFPESDMAALRSIYEQNVPVSIQCPFTDILLLRPDRSGSDQVVLTELRFPEIAGVKNVRPYELRMISDEPFNLIKIS